MANNVETINSICLDINLKNIPFVKSELHELPHVRPILKFIENLLDLKLQTLAESSAEKVIIHSLGQN